MSETVKAYTAEEALELARDYALRAARIERDHPDDERLLDAAEDQRELAATLRLYADLLDRSETYRQALEEIRNLDTRPHEAFPDDLQEQINACGECQGWAKNHPIQNGICDTHRKPLYARERHDKNEVSALGGRMRSIARKALSGKEE